MPCHTIVSQPDEMTHIAKQYYIYIFEFLYHIQKGNLPVTVSMSKVQTSSSDAD